MRTLRHRHRHCASIPSSTRAAVLTQGLCAALAHTHTLTVLPCPLATPRRCASQVEGRFYVNKHLEELMMEELKQYASARGVGGFLPAVKQIANVAALPGIVGVRCA